MAQVDPGNKKRKLSVSVTATTEGQMKRTKSQQDESTAKPLDVSEATAKPAIGATNESDVDESDEDEGQDRTHDTGPTIFYLYGDGVMSIVVEEEDYPLIRLKSSVHRAWKDLEARGGDVEKVSDDEWTYGQGMAHWLINAWYEDRDTDGARALRKVYDGLSENEEKSGDSEFHWWYEVTMQGQPPDDDREPALKVLLKWDDGAKESLQEGKDHEGVWWITDVKWADETNPALKYFGENIPYDNPNPC